MHLLNRKYNFRIFRKMLGLLGHVGGSLSRAGTKGLTINRWLSTSPYALSKIIYTETDEAPMLATFSLLPVIQRFAKPMGIEVREIEFFKKSTWLFHNVRYYSIVVVNTRNIKYFSSEVKILQTMHFLQRKIYIQIQFMIDAQLVTGFFGFVDSRFYLKEGVLLG